MTRSRDYTSCSNYSNYSNYSKYSKEIELLDKSVVFVDMNAPVSCLWQIIQRNLRYGYFQTAIYQLRTGLINPYQKRMDIETGISNKYICCDSDSSSETLQHIIVE